MCRVLTQAQVEARVAGMVERSGLTIEREGSAARAACVTGRGVPSPAFGGHSRFVVRWQDADLSRLPRELTDELASGKFHNAEVASCPPQGQQDWFTAYRVVVLLY